MMEGTGEGSRHDPLEQSRAFGVIDVLEAVGATYAIWGGLAVVAYNEGSVWQMCQGAGE